MIHGLQIRDGQTTAGDCSGTIVLPCTPQCDTSWIERKTGSVKYNDAHA